MTMFSKSKATGDEPMTYYTVNESVAGGWGCLQLGEVLEVASDDVPAEVRDLERRGLLRALPDPGPMLPWLRLALRFRPVSAATFAVRPEPPEPVFLDEPAVLTRYRWSPAELRQAQVTIGFPRETKRRTRFNPDTGTDDLLGRFWSESELARWEADRASTARGLLGRVFTGLPS